MLVELREALSIQTRLMVETRPAVRSPAYLLIPGMLGPRVGAVWRAGGGATDHFPIA